MCVRAVSVLRHHSSTLREVVARRKLRADGRNLTGVSYGSRLLVRPDTRSRSIRRAELSFNKRWSALGVDRNSAVEAQVVICLVEATTPATEVDGSDSGNEDGHATNYNACNCAGAEIVAVAAVIVAMD